MACSLFPGSLIPFGNGPDSFNRVKQAVEIIADALCEGCIAHLSVSTVPSNFFSVGFGEVAPEICDKLTVYITDSADEIYEAVVLDPFASNPADRITDFFQIYPVVPVGADIPHSYADLKIRWMANDKIMVSGGAVSFDSTLINKIIGTVLTMGTGGDWVDGVSGEAASTFAHVYIRSNGTIRLHDTMPNTSAVGGGYVATMRVNQLGWNGTAGNGLNATSVVYDTDTNEGSIAAGMLVGVYSDSIYTLGRGKGSAASASLQNMSFALITAVNTATNTLTLEAGHQIAINDNDFLIVIENAPVVYRDEGGTVWRWLGAMFNNGSSNLDANRTHHRAYYQANEVSDYTTTSATIGHIDGTNFNPTLIFTESLDVSCNLNGSFEHSSPTGRTWFGLLVDGVQEFADDGLISTLNPDGAGGGRPSPLSFSVPVLNRLPGTHNFSPQWKTSAATATLHAGAGTANKDSHTTFSVHIIK